MHAIESGAPGLAEGLGASLATVASLTLTVDHGVPFALASVGATASIMTKTTKCSGGFRGILAAEPAFFATLTHDCVGCYRFRACSQICNALFICSIPSWFWAML
jgi:formate hydrogenlyase subunit 6/NADH:ubiquinone oxidoreductase subunit I